MRAILVFHDTNTQYDLGDEELVNTCDDWGLKKPRSNGSQIQYPLDGETPASIVANCHSDAAEYLADQYARQKGV